MKRQKANTLKNIRQAVWIGKISKPISQKNLLSQRQKNRQINCRHFGREFPPLIMFTYTYIKALFDNSDDHKRIKNFHNKFSSLLDTAVGTVFLNLGWRRVVVNAKQNWEKLPLKIQSRLLKDVNCLKIQGL